MLTRALIPTLLLALALPAAADEKAAERERGKALVASFTGVDEALLGTFHFAHIDEGRNVGSQVIKVERAPAKSGAVYRVEIKGKSEIEEMGGEETTEVTLLDAKLALVSHSGSSVGTLSFGGEKQTRRLSVKVTREGKAWKQVTVQDGKERVVRFETDSPDYGQPASRLLLCRKLKLGEAHRLRLPMLFFDLLPDDDEGSSIEDVQVVVPAAAPFAHRGQEVQAHQVTVEGLLKHTVVVDPRGALLATWLGVGPRFGNDRYVAAADADEAAKDTEARDESPEAAAALAAVVTWHEVLAGEKPVEALDGVSDWTALRDQAAERDPKLGELTPEAFAARSREKSAEMRKMLGKLAKDMLGMARKGRARVDGDEATVSLMGGEEFRLRRADGAWRLVRLPRS